MVNVPMETFLFDFFLLSAYLVLLGVFLLISYLVDRGYQTRRSHNAVMCPNGEVFKDPVTGEWVTVLVNVVTGERHLERSITPPDREPDHAVTIKRQDTSL